MTEPAATSKYERDPLAWWPWVALAALFLVVYGWGDYSQIGQWGNIAAQINQEKLPTFGFLVRRWIIDDSVQHGWLVGPISAVVIWYKRETLKRLPRTSHVGGLWVIAGALLFHLSEKALDINGPSGISIPIFLAGSVWYLCGTAWVRELAFPLAYLLFFIPVPGGLTTPITTPLRILATKGSAFLTSHMGVTIFATGVNLDFFRPNLPQTVANHVKLDIADACSGIHSIMAIKALHAITAYLSRLKLKWKWLLFWLALPITTASNVVRITLLVLVAAYYDPKFATTYFHDKSPYPLFIIVFLMLVSIGRLMERLTGGEKWFEERKKVELAEREANPNFVPWQRIGPTPKLGRPAILLASAAILTVFFWSRPAPYVEGADVTRIPTQIGEWRSLGDLNDSDEVMKKQNADSYLHRQYIRPRDGMMIEFLVVYRKFGRRDFAHRPDQCYPSAGFELIRQDATTLPWNHRDVAARHILAGPGNVVSGDGKPMPTMTTTYLFASGNRTESDFLKQQLWMALERLFPNRNGWTFFRLNSYHAPLMLKDKKLVFNREATPYTDAEAIAAQQDFLRAGDDEIRRVITTDSAAAD